MNDENEDNFIVRISPVKVIMAVIFLDIMGLRTLYIWIFSKSKTCFFYNGDCIFFNVFMYHIRTIF